MPFKSLDPQFIFSKMSPQEVSQILGVTVGTLAQWRHHGRYSLPYFKIGRLVYYNRSDVMKFIEGCRIGEIK